MKAHPHIAQLPVRLPVRPDEWAETYLVSLARAQGLSKPKASDVARLRAFLPRECTSLSTSESSGPASPPPAGGAARSSALALPRWAFIARGSPLRYCPLCLVDAPYFRSRWRLAGLHACPVHGCFLKSDLFEDPITAYFARASRRSLVEASTENFLDGAVCCSAEELRATTMVWGELERQVPTDPTPDNHLRFTTLACWSAFLWKIIDYVAFSHHTHVLHQPSRGELARVVRFIKDLHIETEPSMDGLLSLFSRLRETVHFRAAMQLIHVLEQQEDRSRTALSSLPLRHLCERLTALAPWSVVPRPVGGTALRRDSEHGICKAALIKQVRELGPGSQAINRLIKDGRIPATKVLRGGKEFTLIQRKHAQATRRALLSLIHLHEFVAQHELDISTYSAIRDSGLLKTGVMREYLYRQEVTALAARLELMSRPAADGDGPRWRVFCATTVNAVGGASLFHGFVHAAIQGHFKVFRDLSKHGLSAFSVGIDAIVWATGRRRAFHAERAAQSLEAQGSLFGLHESEAMA